MVKFMDNVKTTLQNMKKAILVGNTNYANILYRKAKILMKLKGGNT